MGDEITMKSKKSNFPLVPIIPVRSTHGRNIWINEKHDTDRDGVPNYRDCNAWNPLEQGLFHKKKKRETLDLTNAPYPEPFDLSDVITDTEENYEKYLAAQRRLSSSSDTRILHTINVVEPKKHIEIYNDIQRGLTRETLMKKYGQKKVMETFKHILVVERRNLEMGKRPTTTDIQKEQQYKMKRDTLALQMYGEHYVSLTAQQKRNVTREFNRMMR